MFEFPSTANIECFVTHTKITLKSKGIKYAEY